MNKQIDYFDKAYECIFTKEYSDEQTIEYFLENQIISDGNDIINIIKILRPIKRASSQAFKAIIFGIVLQIPLLILFASSNRIALGACCIGLASIIIGIKKKYRIRRILKQIRFSLKDGHIEPLSYYIPKKNYWKIGLTILLLILSLLICIYYFYYLAEIGLILIMLIFIVLIVEIADILPQKSI